MTNIGDFGITMEVTKRICQFECVYTCIHGSFCVEAVCAALICLSAQRDPSRLLRKPPSADRPGNKNTTI